MNQIVTRAIVLTRTDYGEADRIVTMITPDHGKLRLMVKGARRVKSRLAGGVELFSVSDITYIAGRGEMGTLISARLTKHYGNIVRDIERVQQGYELIKLLNRATEDDTDEAYFTLIERAFAALDEDSVPLLLTQLWFQAQLLGILGHLPQLLNDKAGHALQADKRYDFDYDSMVLIANESGKLVASDIKVLRLLFSDNSPRQLTVVEGLIEHLDTVSPVVRYMAGSYLPV